MLDIVAPEKCGMDSKLISKSLYRERDRCRPIRLERRGTMAGGFDYNDLSWIVVNVKDR